VLQRNKVNLPDPVELVRGVSARLLLEGSWPPDELYSQGALDALVAAFTAWQAANHPDQITALGDDAEGLVIRRWGAETPFIRILEPNIEELIRKAMRRASSKTSRQRQAARPGGKQSAW
jgi:hypothetical protein